MTRRIALAVVAAIAWSWSAHAQSEGIVYDGQTGTYTIYYYSLDTLRQGLYIPGNVADPSLSATVTPTEGAYDYGYTLYNSANSIRALSKLRVGVLSNVTDSWAPDSNWYARRRGGGFYWSQIGPDSLDIEPGDSLSGFGFESAGLPTILKGNARNHIRLEFEDEGLTSTALLNELDSLVAYTRFTWLVTIAPRDPPTPFDLGDFLDTLATYPLRAAAQGWIADSTAGDLDRLLGDATTALSGGDSTWAATLLATVRNHVETVKDDSLSSEGYALMKYNIDYALAYLPAVIEVKAFLQGAYSAGQLTKNILDYIPSTQPFGDSLDVWKYNGPERLTRVPSFITDWVLVSAAVLAPDTMLVGHGAALLDDQGVATVAVGSNLPDSVYVVVEHRNHIMVMSDTLVDVSSGHAEHDFTTGHAFKATAEPQKRIVSGQDTVYVMWTADGDGSADGQVTALDFVAWLAATTAGATGYVPTDFNLDGQVTALDFTDWLVNTTAGAKRGVLEAIHGLIVHKSTGVITQMGIAAQSEGGGPQAYVRLVVTRDTGHDFWVDIEAKSDSSALPENTVAGAVLDVYYDDTELSLASADVGVLDLDAGYANNVSDSEEEGRRFIRVEFRARENQYPWHDLATDWEVVSSLHFSRTPPPHDDGTSIRRYTLAMAFYDKHSNIDASYAYHQIVIEVQ
ncbi:MAG: hypothetical protein WBW88_05980 [Rhodothermales bacterium]